MSSLADPLERLSARRPEAPEPLGADARDDLLARIAISAGAPAVMGSHGRRGLSPVPLAVLVTLAVVAACAMVIATSRAPSAAAAIEHRLHSVAVVTAKDGARLNTRAASILGSANDDGETVYLVTGFQLVGAGDSQCIGLLAGQPLDVSFSRLPDSDLYFGDYDCGSSGSTFASKVLGDAVVLWGHVVDPPTVRVTLEGPVGSTQLPMRDGYFGTIVPFQPRPTRIAEYDAAGTLAHSWAIDPRQFTKGYRSPDATDAHHTLIAGSLPDGSPVTLERSDGEDLPG
jgi:hypothetical protein